MPDVSTIISPDVIQTTSIITPDMILTVLGGVLITSCAGIINQFVKQKYFRLVVLLVCILVGMVYQVFRQFLPEELKEAIFNFMLYSLSIAVLLYEFIWSVIKKVTTNTISETSVVTIEKTIEATPAPEISESTQKE